MVSASAFDVRRLASQHPRPVGRKTRRANGSAALSRIRAGFEPRRGRGLSFRCHTKAMGLPGFPILGQNKSRAAAQNRRGQPRPANNVPRRADFFALPIRVSIAHSRNGKRLITPPPPLLRRRWLLLRRRLWRWRRFNNSGIQEFSRTVHHRREIEFPIRISKIYRSSADNLQLSIRKPFC